ncbi:MAG: VOC family protein [Vulcanimicrobiaceae bacterium]
MIKEIAFVAYPADDVAALIPFYRDKLGLQLSNTYDEDGRTQWAEFSTPNNGWFGIMTKDWLERPAGSGSGVAFEVDDLDRAIADLRGKGVEIDDPYATPVCKLASFIDPEGNKITLHQITVPH